MALIQCPGCGCDISDKAPKCIHCGKILIEEIEIVEEVKEVKCSECGAILKEEDETCPNCGCPVEKEKPAEDAIPQRDDVGKAKPKNLKLIIGIAIAAIVLIIGGIGFKKVSDETNAKNAYNTYIDNLESARMAMLNGGSEAESLCNLTLKVWHNAIYEDRDSETDKYTRPNGYFLSDFNDALSNLYADSDTTSSISLIEDYQTSVKAKIKELQNPPEGLETCYNTITELYSAFNKLTELAINPTGSYTSFSSDKGDSIDDFMTAFEKLDTQIPEKME